MNTKPAGNPFPFAGNVLENLELMSKAWSAGLAQMPGVATPASMAQSIPSMMMPTLDVTELDKRITDLRAVEQWLALNANMLRASIQALEVQRNTIATLQTLGATMMKPASAQAGTQPPPAWPHAAPTPGASAADAPADAGTTGRRAKKAANTEASPAQFAEMPLNPAAWWSNLQDQFTRIAAAASGDPKSTAPVKDSASKGAPARETAREDTRPAARKPPTRRTS